MSARSHLRSRSGAPKASVRLPACVCGCSVGQGARRELPSGGLCGSRHGAERREMGAWHSHSPVLAVLLGVPSEAKLGNFEQARRLGLPIHLRAGTASVRARAPYDERGLTPPLPPSQLGLKPMGWQGSAHAGGQRGVPSNARTVNADLVTRPCRHARPAERFARPFPPRGRPSCAHGEAPWGGAKLGGALARREVATFATSCSAPAVTSVQPFRLTRRLSRVQAAGRRATRRGPVRRRRELAPLAGGPSDLRA